MKIRFCLDQLLHEEGQEDSRGRIQEISRQTGLERHRVSDLLKNKVQRLSLHDLGLVCGYLMKQHGVDPNEIFNRLFALEPSAFLSMLQDAGRLTTCFGVRRGTIDPEQRWATSADSYLHGKILEQVFRPVHLERHSQKPTSAGGSAPKTNHRSRIEEFHQQLVHAFRGALVPEEDTREALRMIMDAANAIDKEIHDKPAGLTTVILGSIKSNPVCEPVIARTFSADCWGHPRGATGVAESDDLESPPDLPTERAVPFFLRYRDKANSEYADPRLPSCCAGLRLAASQVNCGNNSSEAGIYFEQANGEWECFPSNSGRDSALVFYDYQRPKSAVDCVMGGFSSEATLALANGLEQIADQLWPPTYETSDRCIGVFVIKFEFDKRAAQRGKEQVLMPKLKKAPQVISLDREVIRRRIEGASEPTNDS